MEAIASRLEEKTKKEENIKGKRTRKEEREREMHSSCMPRESRLSGNLDVYVSVVRFGRQHCCLLQAMADSREEAAKPPKFPSRNGSNPQRGHTDCTDVR